MPIGACMGECAWFFLFLSFSLIAMRQWTRKCGKCILLFVCDNLFCFLVFYVLQTKWCFIQCFCACHYCFWCDVFIIITATAAAATAANNDDANADDELDLCVMMRST